MATVRLIFVLLLWNNCGQSVLGRNGTMDHWIRLTNTLLSNYTREIWPVYNFSEALTVDITMFMMSILDFDEIAGVITISGGVLLGWNDFRLKWNPSNYGGIEDILIKSSLMWKPNVFLVSTAADLRPFDSGKFDVRLFHNGSCFIAPGKQMKASCSVDVSKFPFDSHICDLLLVQWDTSGDEIKLVYTQTVTDLSYYTPNGEWDVVKTSVSMSVKFEGGVSFRIFIRRKAMYFALSLMVPILLLCFLNPFVFLIPASSGERISYTITMFLSLAVYMSIIGDNLPKVSENMAFMSFFMLIVLIYSGTLILFTILTLRCEALSEFNEFPEYIKRLTIFLYKQCRHRASEVVEVDDKEKSEKDDPMTHLQKDDVMRLIDVFLFVTSLSLISVVTVCFFSVLFS